MKIEVQDLFGTGHDRLWYYRGLKFMGVEMFRWLVIVSNTGLLCALLYSLMTGFIHTFVFTGITASFLLTILYVFNSPSSDGEESLLGLWVKVKKANLKKQLD